MKRGYTIPWIVLMVALPIAAGQESAALPEAPTPPDYTLPEFTFEVAEPLEITQRRPADREDHFQVYFITNKAYSSWAHDPEAEQTSPRKLADVIRERILADPAVGPQLSERQRRFLRDSTWLSPLHPLMPTQRFPTYAHLRQELRARDAKPAALKEMDVRSFVAASEAEARLIATKILEYTNAYAQELRAATTRQLAAEEQAVPELDAALTAARQRLTQAAAAVDAAKAKVTVASETEAREELLMVYRDLRRVAVELAGSEARAVAIARLKAETSSAPVHQRLEIMLVEHDVDLADTLARQAALVGQQDLLRNFIDAARELRFAECDVRARTDGRAAKQQLIERLRRELDEPSRDAQPVQLIDNKFVLQPFVVPRGGPDSQPTTD